jgi:hypothetical protein
MLRRVIRFREQTQCSAQLAHYLQLCVLVIKQVHRSNGCPSASFIKETTDRTLIKFGTGIYIKSWKTNSILIHIDSTGYIF